MDAPSKIVVACALILIALIFVASIQWRLSEIENRVAALSRLDAKLDLLLKQAGIQYDPYKNLPHEIVDAVRAGKKIQAIKRYREIAGVGLKEAKDFIEEIQRRAGVG